MADQPLHPILTDRIYQPPRPKLVFGVPPLDGIQAAQTEALLKRMFPDHDIVLLAGMAGMMEVRGA